MRLSVLVETCGFDHGIRAYQPCYVRKSWPQLYWPFWGGWMILPLLFERSQYTTSINFSPSMAKFDNSFLDWISPFCLEATSKLICCKIGTIALPSRVCVLWSRMSWPRTFRLKCARISSFNLGVAYNIGYVFRPIVFFAQFFDFFWIQDCAKTIINPFS